MIAKLFTQSSVESLFIFCYVYFWELNSTEMVGYGFFHGKKIKEGRKTESLSRSRGVGGFDRGTRGTRGKRFETDIFRSVQ